MFEEHFNTLLENEFIKNKTIKKKLTGYILYILKETVPWVCNAEYMWGWVSEAIFATRAINKVR